ncbi:MAG TPA: hypothetical protein VF469_17530, partial [Kofleriaceae bacterium]
MTMPLCSRALARVAALVIVPVLACAVPGAPAKRSSPAAAPGSLDATEREVARAVDAGNPDALALLER